MQIGHQQLFPCLALFEKNLILVHILHELDRHVQCNKYNLKNKQKKDIIKLMGILIMNGKKLIVFYTHTIANILLKHLENS